ncbi:MAG: phosphatidate cytidylyltransferase [Alphaproteobacteria bacterium]|nr:phosphatidate cytidylyltransferase [Alphaproteobacteria bacterium]
MRLPPFLQRFDTVNLRMRIISSLIMVPGVLLAVWLGGLAYGAMVTCVATLGLFEWLRLVTPQAKAQTVGIACAMLIVLTTAGFFISISFGALLGVIFTLALFLILIRDHDERAGWAALGIPYMGGSALALLALRALPDYGAAFVLYLLVTVWGTDIGAFVAGRMIGGPKLAPAISPSKTWAGLLGGMALSVILGYLAALFLNARHPAVALALSPVLACVAQVGDLFESYFKRRSGVKESGDLIPGHGGVLDRIDGLVFAGVFAFLFQAALGQQMGLW